MTPLLLLLSLALLPTSTAQLECAQCTASQKCATVCTPAQSATDDQCKVCAPASNPNGGTGQTWWPCNLANMCECRAPSSPCTPPPIPSSGLAASSDSVCGTLFTEANFNTLAPNAQAPYTYAGFCQAIAEWDTAHPEEKVFGMGSLAQRKGELAAFLGNTLHESGDFQAGREYLPCGDRITVSGTVYCKPCASGNYNWGTHTCSVSSVAGSGTYSDYCDDTKSLPQACNCGPVAQSSDAGVPAGYIDASKAFYGRGAIQLSWNYNYIDASKSLTGSASTFCDNPDLIGRVSFLVVFFSQAAIWGGMAKW